MTDTNGTIEFLAESARHADERPYTYHPGADEGLSADDSRLTNMHFTSITKIIRDIRSAPVSERGLENSGFDFVEHKSENLEFGDLSCVKRYEKETEDLLRETLKAEAVVCCRSIVSIVCMSSLIC